MSKLYDVSIALTRYKESDDIVEDALRSLSLQEDITAEVLVLDQKKSVSLRGFANSLNTDTIDFKYDSIPTVSLSYARNLAVERAISDIVLFIDADAVAHPRWAVELAEVFSKPSSGIVGGKILPRWHKRPLLAAKAHWVWEQYSLLDLGNGVITTHKVVGANFAIHRGRLAGEAYFDERLGRRDGILLGGEETDLCRRAAKAGWQTCYNGRAIVEHQVLPERIRYKWLLKRVYYAGYSRAVTGGEAQPTHALGGWDYAILPLLAPFYIVGKYLGKRDRS